MIFNSIIDLIGGTPVLKLNNLDKNIAEIYVKLEKFNPAGSIKDRPALGMIEDAEKTGKLKPGNTIIEPTSGNMGIALAMIGKVKKYKVIIVMPETMSIERRQMIQAYGAQLILTEGSLGMKGAIAKSEELVNSNKDYFMPMQFVNKANSQNHYETTAEEIIKDVKDVDAFIAGVGTGGTVSGVGKRLKEFNEKIKIIGVEPKKSAVLTGGKPGPHKIQGIGAGFIPDLYDSEVIDEVLDITDEESIEYAKYIAQNEGVLVGISSGANIAAAFKIAKELGSGHKVVTVAPDGGEKYLSMGVF